MMLGLLIIAAVGVAALIAGVANDGYTTYFKVQVNQETQFDLANGYGLTFVGNVANTSTLAWAPIASHFGPNTDAHAQPGMLFDPPIELLPSDACVPYVTFAGAFGNSVAASSVDVTFITEIELP